MTTERATGVAASNAVQPPMTPGVRAHYAFATWFGCGFSRLAPGTVGSLGAVPLFWLVAQAHSLWVNLAAIVMTSVTGAWSAHVVAQHRSDDDPGLVVVDEVAGVLIALTWVQSFGWQYQALAWGLFRLFDITKPGPIRTLEHTKPIGVGIMLDDLLAGLVAGVLAFGVAQLVG